MAFAIEKSSLEGKHSLVKCSSLRPKGAIIAMESLRPLLTRYAYNISGSSEDAEDIVQDVYLKFFHIDKNKIENVKSYLVRMVINHTINQKKHLKKKLVTYPGNSLPEAVAIEKTDGGLIKKDVLSHSIIVLLRKLNAKQRAVFILKEAFDYQHIEIARVLGLTEEQSRQILTRAKKNLRLDAPAKNKNFQPEHVKKYMEALLNGDAQKLEELLNEDIA